MADEVAEEEATIAENFLHQCMFFIHLESRKKRPKVDHRTLPRKKKREFRHDEALHCIRRDYLGIMGDLTTPIFAGSEFATMFRISRPRFERLMQDFVLRKDRWNDLVDVEEHARLHAALSKFLCTKTK